MAHELDMCCGSTCNKALNTEYVRELEQQVKKLKQELAEYKQGEEIEYYSKRGAEL